MLFSEWLSSMRKEHGMSRTDLAREMKCAPSIDSIKGWEKGEHFPAYVYIECFSTIFHTDAHEIGKMIQEERKRKLSEDEDPVSRMLSQACREESNKDKERDVLRILFEILWSEGRIRKDTNELPANVLSGLYPYVVEVTGRSGAELWNLLDRLAEVLKAVGPEEIEKCLKETGEFPLV